MSMCDGDGQLFTFHEFYLSAKNTFGLLASFNNALDNLDIKPYNLFLD